MVNKKRAGQKLVVARLVSLKLQLDAMKPIYAEYDRVLDLALKHGNIPDKVTLNGTTYVIALTDIYESKNTAWKSVAQRRFDIAVSKKSKLF